MKNIKVKRHEDDNSVKVRIEHNAKMTSTVDKLLKLDECDCRQAIRVSRKYRRANKATTKFIDDERLKIKRLSRIRPTPSSLTI